VHKRLAKVFTISVLLLLLTAITPFTVLAASTSPSSKATSQPSTGGTNPYDPAYQHSYRHGAVPTTEQLVKIKSYQKTHAATSVTPVTSANTLQYNGGIDGIGVTSGYEKVYLIFWGTQWGTQSTDSNGNLTFSSDYAGVAPILQNLFKGLGTGGEQWSGTMTQYCDGSSVPFHATSCPSNAAHVGYPVGGVLAGVWYDNSGTEPDPATGDQLANETINAAGHFGNTTAASNRYTQYVILSATGTNPDNYKTGGFCAWHSFVNGGGPSPYGDIAYTNMPYIVDVGWSCGENFVNSGSAGTLDGVTIVEGHEYAETITDQNPAGGWTAGSGAETGDECAWISSGQGAAGNVTMGNGTYAMQSTWSNDTNECDLTHSIYNASYKIVNVHSGLVLGISYGSTSPGAQALQWTDTGAADHLWKFVYAGNGEYKISNENSGLVLGISYGSTSPGEQALQWTDTGAADHLWKLIYAGNGEYKISNENSGLVLGIAYGSTSSGEQALQWTDTGAADHLWQIVQA
jgi:serine protease